MTYTVLLVDDTCTCRETIAMILRAGGYRVVMAEDARRAIDMLENCTPDVILLDLAMPHTSGLELLRQIRESPQWRDLPAILFTGSGDLLHLTDGLGVVETLVKSHATTAQIRQAVARAVMRPEPMRPDAPPHAARSKY